MNAEWFMSFRYLELVGIPQGVGISQEVTCYSSYFVVSQTTNSMIISGQQNGGPLRVHKVRS